MGDCENVILTYAKMDNMCPMRRQAEWRIQQMEGLSDRALDL